jgi:hypothetical protein
MLNSIPNVKGKVFSQISCRKHGAKDDFCEQKAIKVEAEICH